jgi:hypothetical protein
VSPWLAAHGHASPAAWGWVEWTIFSLCALVTAWVLWLSVRWTLRPGEEEPDHIKRSILDDDAAPTGVATPPRR